MAGRPRSADEARKSKNFTFRGTLDLHEKLRVAANEHGRSVGDEISARLGRSFDSDLDVERVFSSPQLFALMRAISVAMERAGRQSAQLKSMTPEEVSTWYRDPYAFHQAVQAAERLLHSFRPAGKPIPPHTPGNEALNSFAKSVGPSVAMTLLTEINGQSGGATSVGKRLASDLDPAWLKANREEVVLK